MPRSILLAAVLIASLVSPHGSHAAEDSTYVADVAFALDELEKHCGHFFDLKSIDWRRVRAEFTKEAREVRNDSEHLWLLIRLTARLRDGHARVVPLEHGRSVELPESVATGERVGPGMAWCSVGKRFYVKHAWSSAERAGVDVGSQVLAVDGQPVGKWLDARVEELRDSIGFSTDHHALTYAMHGGLSMPRGSTLKLELKLPRGKRSKKTITYSGNASARHQGPVAFPEGIDGDGDVSFGKTKRGFGYVYLRKCPNDLPERMDRALAAIGDVPGLILDFRGNSGGAFDHDGLLGRFIPKGREIAFAKRVASAGPAPYGGPVVVIVDSLVVSAGETGSGMFKEDGRAYMIGEGPTAGMSSQKTTIELPSRLFGLYVSIGSNKGRFNQGRGIEGIGVLPHETIAYDPKDLANRVDTLIEAAEKRLLRFPQKDVPYDPADFGWNKPR